MGQETDKEISLTRIHSDFYNSGSCSFYVFGKLLKNSGETNIGMQDFFHFAGARGWGRGRTRGGLGALPKKIVKNGLFLNAF